MKGKWCFAIVRVTLKKTEMGINLTLDQQLDIKNLDFKIPLP